MFLFFVFFSFEGIIRTVDSIPSGLYDNVYDMRTKEGSVYPFTEKLMGARCVAVVVGWWIDGEREREEKMREREREGKREREK